MPELSKGAAVGRGEVVTTVEPREFVVVSTRAGMAEDVTMTLPCALVVVIAT